MKVSELIAQLQKMVELNPEVANLEIYNSLSNTEEIKLTEVYYAGGIPSQDGYNNVNYFTKDFDEAKHYSFDELELCVVLTNTTDDDFINKLNPTNFKKVVKKYTKKRLFIRIISKLKVIAKKILCKK